ncbi:hypothetical protein GUJ93_ZPchr0006g43188 [Zizania palustris]|uniref:Uncharacterized protein n=1 Tax=Zizania palustris TaxID=103762 RepID=A0A8J5S8R1_ZIZPA|nr:hypothetical protein GUJ93_ZPchr0006g43188 [Zizania palustris]
MAPRSGSLAALVVLLLLMLLRPSRSFSVGSGRGASHHPSPSPAPSPSASSPRKAPSGTPSAARSPPPHRPPDHSGGAHPSPPQEAERKRRLNLGERAGIALAAVAVVMQVALGAFLAVRARQLRAGRTGKGGEEAAPWSSSSAAPA